jgi:ABC-type nitrate/sulfonate/bicarbonate transport system ATPase subunit
MKTRPVIKISDLSYSYSLNRSEILFPVLRNITLAVNRREIVSIIGPTGCGKSTLFNILSGITSQSSGTIEIDGAVNDRRLGKFGYMFQEPLLFPWATILENVMVGYEIKGIPRTIAKNHARFVLKEFGLMEYADLYPATLSGGMKQKCALLRTVAFNSSLLLLDEPFGSLDAITRTSLHLYLLRLWQKLSLTVLFTTHDIKEAIFLSDRIYVMSARPGTFTDCLRVQIPRPRHIRMITSPGFVRLERKLLGLLNPTL